jgi:hypothetical protein
MRTAALARIGRRFIDKLGQHRDHCVSLGLQA